MIDTAPQTHTTGRLIPWAKSSRRACSSRSTDRSSAGSTSPSGVLTGDSDSMGLTFRQDLARLLMVKRLHRINLRPREVSLAPCLGSIVLHEEAPAALE